MDEKIDWPEPDDDGVLGEQYEAELKDHIARYYRAKHPHLRQPLWDPWIREGETNV
jgi:hypothetical protein